MLESAVEPIGEFKFIDLFRAGVILTKPPLLLMQGGGVNSMVMSVNPLAQLHE